MSRRKSITGGVIAAAITPRRSREYSIDLGASLELLDFLYEGGVDAIALLGSTGEFLHFPHEDRARMLDFAVKRSRLPILVNVSHSTLDGAVFLAQEAAGSGVAAVLLMPPYYFRYSQETVRTFCLEFAETIAKEVPVYLYNIPVFTNELALDTAIDLLSTGMFAGIKDSGGTWEYLEGLLSARGQPPFHIFPGDERLYLKARPAGVDGMVSGVACAVPELLVRLERAIRAGEQDLAQRLDARVHEFIDWICQFPAPVGIKEVMQQRKIKAGVPATPLGQEEAQLLARFSCWFKDWLPAVLKECR